MQHRQGTDYTMNRTLSIASLTLLAAASIAAADSASLSREASSFVAHLGTGSLADFTTDSEVPAANPSDGNPHSVPSNLTEPPAGFSPTFQDSLPSGRPFPLTGMDEHTLGNLPLLSSKQPWINTVYPSGGAGESPDPTTVPLPAPVLAGLLGLAAAAAARRISRR